MIPREIAALTASHYRGLMPWTAADLPTLTGRRAIVTGANSGLGWWTAYELAAHGTHVTMAVRDTAKGAAARTQMNERAGRELPLSIGQLDLADLASVRVFAQEWSRDNPEGLDLLINNAGIMAIPRTLTRDGFEMQFGTNHLGHYALTGLLFPALVAIPHSRVVTVSSGAHRMGKLKLADLMGEQRYSAWGAYGQSKLANLLFTSELQRRIDNAGISMLALAAHPGFASTNLQAVGPSMRFGSRGKSIADLATKAIAQSAEMGALPTLYAATEPNLPGGAYIGPDGFMEQRGHPKVVGRSAAASDEASARELWAVSEDLTGVRFPIG